jgi:hypothetical protein
MSGKGEVRFIRKDGRVIPIKSKTPSVEDDKKKLRIKIGSALTSSGLVAGAATAYAAGKTSKDAMSNRRFAIKSKNLGTNYIFIGAKSHQKSKKQLRTAAKLRKAARFGSATMVGLGIEQFARAGLGAGIGAESLAVGAGILAGVATEAGIRKGRKGIRIRDTLSKRGKQGAQMIFDFGIKRKFKF